MTRAEQSQVVPEQPRGAFVLERIIVPIGAVEPDPRNRCVLDDDEFRCLVESIRVLGLLQPIHVRLRGDGRYELVDGERRWRAAHQAGLEEILCDVWPSDANPAELALAGFALNEQRKAPGCVHVARRLRDMKNELGYSHEQLAAQAGLPLDRVKTYFALFGASDFLLTFFENHEIPLKVAVEFVRYEKATNEGHARKLVNRYLEAPLTAHELAAFRKKQEPARSGKERKKEPLPALSPSRMLLERFEALLTRELMTTMPELEKLLARLGYQVVPMPSAAKAR